MRLLSVAVAAAVATAVVVAQGLPLNPTSNLTIDASATQGLLSYSHIHIPAGVRVTYTENYPIQIRCAGNVTIDGAMSVSALLSNGPGAVFTGAGSTGSQYTYPWICGAGSSGSNGRHAGVYGSTLPFSLAGGSPGGGVVLWGQSSPFGGPCNQFWNSSPGGGGGGTLVLEAAGTIDVSGTVEANGSPAWFTYTGAGSGGSILLRGLSRLTIHPSGTVSARPGDWPYNTWPQHYGYIRLDAYGQPPTALGVIDPVPHVVRLPLLVETQPPTIGASWDLQVFAPAGDGVFLAASFQPGSYTGSYGTVGIDIYTAITFGLVTMPATGHDPVSTFQLPIPNVPAFVGLNLWTAGLDWYTSLSPRYSNTIPSVVQ